MKVSESFCICFSGISIRFILPTPIELPEELFSFLCEDPVTPDAEYEIRLLHEPLRPKGTPVYIQEGTKLYHTEEGWLRIYPMQLAEDGCQVACLLRLNGKNILYHPASVWERYSNPLHCLPQLGIEVSLLRQNAFLLHSSVVKINGKAVLFSGPSGAGKSTQADLWARYLGADILNGDRCVIKKESDGFYGSGSPWAGTSSIYRRERAPIAGIFLVNQADENSVQRLGAAAFPPLFSQTLVNSWDSQFMEHITELFQDLLSQVPVYRLNCLPDEEAVYTAYQALF